MKLHYYKLMCFNEGRREYGAVVSTYEVVSSKKSPTKFIYFRIEAIYAKYYTGLAIGDYIYEFRHNVKKITDEELACYLL